MVPGIRREDEVAGDQVRVATAREAARAGATHLVVGRPVLQATDPARCAAAPDRGGALRRLLILIALLAPPAIAGAQDSGLTGAAEAARQAWFDHDARGLVADAPRLLVQLPGADPSIALGPAQAAALLSDFMVQGQEVETMVRAAKEVEPGRGYVELQRRYRIAGTQDVRTQSLLLGYRLLRSGWRLVELRVVGRSETPLRSRNPSHPPHLHGLSRSGILCS